MSAQPSVLQVVVMRDGLLVGTEVFVPGQYSVGSAPDADLVLDDLSVGALHAYLQFRAGKSAIQEATPATSVFVNGHRVSICELRSMDEVSIGPFSLKVRVVTQRASVPQGMPQGPVPAQPQSAIPTATRPPAIAPVTGAPRPAPLPPPVQPPPPPPVSAPQPPAHASGASAQGTVVSTRRSSAGTLTDALPPAGEEAVPSAAPMPPPAATQRPLGIPPPAGLGGHGARQGPGPDAPTREVRSPVRRPPSEPLGFIFDDASTDGAQRAERAPEPSNEPTVLASMPDLPPQHPPRAAPQASAAEGQRLGRGEVPTSRDRAAAARPARPEPSARTGPAPLPVPPDAADGQGRARLFVELYWGAIRLHARSYTRFDEKKGLVAREDDGAPLPLWGFGLEGRDFQFAQERGGVYRVYVPPGSRVEQRATDLRFYPIDPSTLEVGPGQRRCITLGQGHAVRLSGNNGVRLLAYVQSPIPRPFANPLAKVPWLALANLVLLTAGFAGFLSHFAKFPEQADFENKNVNPVALRLIAPPKKEEKKKVEKIEEQVKKAKEKAKPEKPMPQTAAKETKRAMKAVEKLAAGPAMKDLMAAIDKMGAGPGAKNAKNDFKLSGLIGKAPIASAGIGSFGIGGGGGGGSGIKGLEMLRGKGGGGIGALGSGGVGKGSVAGTVTRATSRAVATQGSIDKDAVAKVINSHLGEVSSCYERALLKESGLAGKIVLEWQISTAGTVTTARSKSSTMRSAAVEQCILNALKRWKFPPAKGAGVIITYPFMFNSTSF